MLPHTAGKSLTGFSGVKTSTLTAIPMRKTLSFTDAAT